MLSDAQPWEKTTEASEASNRRIHDLKETVKKGKGSALELDVHVKGCTIGHLPSFSRDGREDGEAKGAGPQTSPTVEEQQGLQGSHKD